jgi:hypothetical protein
MGPEIHVEGLSNDLPARLMSNAYEKVESTDVVAIKSERQHMRFIHDADQLCITKPESHNFTARRGGRTSQ